MSQEKPNDVKAQGRPAVLEYTTIKPAKKANREAALACKLGLGALVGGFVVLVTALLFWPSGIMWVGAIGCAAGGLGAIGYGIAGLIKSREVNMGGRLAAVVGGLLGLMSCGMMALAMNVMIWGMPVPQRANVIYCCSNLREIGQGLMLYATDHGGQFPGTLSLLITEADVPPAVFICPASDDEAATGATTQAQAKDLCEGGHLSYVYLRPQGNGTPPANVVVAYEPLSNHHGRGMSVLFGDGHVEWITGATARRMIDQLRAGMNPPTTRPAGGKG